MKKVTKFIKNINWELILEAVILSGATLVVNHYKTQKRYDNIIDIDTYVHKTKNVDSTYSDAVSSVLKSDMFSTHKRKAVDLIKIGKSDDYYNAIVQVASDNGMFSSHRLNLIGSLAEHE